MFKLASVLIVLSIFSDVTSLGGCWLNSNRPAGDIRFIQSPSSIFPGADAQALEKFLLNAIAQAIVEEVLTSGKQDKGG